MVTQSFYQKFARTLVIVVSPHPDDSVLGAGGLIYRLTDRTSWERQSDVPEEEWPAVYTIVMTSGSRGVDDEYLRRFTMKRIREDDPALGEYLLRKSEGRADDPQREQALTKLRTEIRRQESLAEARILRVRESFFLDLQGIYYRHTIEPQDRKVFRDLVFSLVDRHPGWSCLFLVAHRDDMHPVHKLSTSLVVEIVENEYSWKGMCIWQYESPWFTFSPHQVEIVIPFGGIGMATKAEAMAVHRSQEYRTKYSDVARYSAQMRAETYPELLGGFGQSEYHWDYVEAFQELRPVTILTVPED